MFYKILVAVDDSLMNRAVFDEALDLARQTGASLMLLHVMTPEERNYPDLSRSYIPYYYPIVTDELLQNLYKIYISLIPSTNQETYRKLPQLRDKQEVEFSGRILPGRFS